MKKMLPAIISANNHYASFGPMTAKVFADTMNLKNHVQILVPHQRQIKLMILL